MNSILINVFESIDWSKDLEFEPYTSPILGRSMLWRTVDRVCNLDYNEIYLNDTSKSEQYLQHLKDGVPWGCNISILNNENTTQEYDTLDLIWNSPKSFYNDIKKILCDGGLNYDLDPSWCDTPGVWETNGCHISENCKIIPPVYIGEGVIINDNTEIGPFVSIEKNSCILENTTVKNSYISENTVIKSNIYLNHFILNHLKLYNIENDVNLEATKDICVNQNNLFSSLVQ